LFVDSWEDTLPQKGQKAVTDTEQRVASILMETVCSNSHQTHCTFVVLCWLHNSGYHPNLAANNTGIGGVFGFLTWKVM